MMFYNNIKKTKVSILSNVKHGDDVIALDIKSSDLMFKVFYKDNTWVFDKVFDYIHLNLIPKELLDEILSKLIQGEINVAEIKDKEIIFVFREDTIFIFLVLENGVDLNVNRVDCEFYSFLLEIPILKNIAQFKFDFYKSLAFFDKHVLIQKIYE